MRRSGYVIAALWMLSLNAVHEQNKAGRPVQNQGFRAIMTRSHSRNNLNSPRNVTGLTSTSPAETPSANSPILFTGQQLQGMGIKMDGQSNRVMYKLLNTLISDDLDDILSEE